MRALVFDGELTLRDIGSPDPLPGEAVIAPHLVGICATDLQITCGYKAFHGVLGHEWVGTVIACDDADWLGARVVGEINVPCGCCATCLRGDVVHCPQRTAMGIMGRAGALAEQFTLPLANLHRVPAFVSDGAAVFTEPLAAALAICDQMHVRPSDHVAVVGDGKLGLLVAQVLRLTGCDLTVVGRHPERWALLFQQRIVAVHQTASDQQRSFDVVVDCTGNPHGLETARKLVRPRGTLVLKSTFAGSTTLDLSSVVVDEVCLVGSRCGPFAAALRLLERGLVVTQPLISAVYPFDQVLQAFDVARGALKVLIQMGRERNDQGELRS
jgi:alcohol dehydrogenase